MRKYDGDEGLSELAKGLLQDCSGMSQDAEPEWPTLRRYIAALEANQTGRERSKLSELYADLGGMYPAYPNYVALWDSLWWAQIRERWPHEVGPEALMYADYHAACTPYGWTHYPKLEPRLP